MSRYIDVDKLGIGRANRDVFENKDYADGWNAAISILEKADVEDLVKVVRCKDCKYYQDNNNGYPHNECKWRQDETPDADDFCSYGERKDEE